MSVITTETTYIYIYKQTITGGRLGVAAEVAAGKPAVVFELAPSARKINEARNDPLYRTRYYWQRNEIEIYRKCKYIIILDVYYILSFWRTE